MVQLSEIEIVNKLKLEDFKKIFETCMYISKTANEIENLTGLSSRDVAEDLEILEKLKAIQLTDGKWTATSLGKRTWIKYFAEPPG